jgi:hypothetical protein
MDEQNVDVVAPEVTEEVVEEVEDIESVRARLAKAEEIAENQRIRAEKAEAKAKERKVEPTNTSLNAGDMMAIKNANIDPQDMDLVEKFSKDNGLSLRESLQHPHVKAILAYEEELRTTAVATNVESVRRGASKMSSEALLQNASAGKIPTSDDEIEALISAKLKRK